MRFSWRDAPLRSHDHWFAKMRGSNPDKPGKNLKPETSAPTLADVWAGPLAVATALSSQPLLDGFVATSASVEAQTSFDDFSGPRNHDLLLIGKAQGGVTVVSVEAKVNEEFGSTISGYRTSASKKDTASNAGKRLDGLLAAIATKPDVDEQDVVDLRYQLYTGAAGVIAAGVDVGAEQVVFLVHELAPDGADAAAHARNANDLRAFMKQVFEVDTPTPQDAPWCVGPLEFVGSERLDPSIRLFIGCVVTDLRSTRFS